MLLWESDQTFSINCPKECRAHDDHCLVIWANMTTVGVMPAAKWEFFFDGRDKLVSGQQAECHCGGDPPEPSL